MDEAARLAALETLREVTAMHIFCYSRKDFIFHVPVAGVRATLAATSTMTAEEARECACSNLAETADAAMLAAAKPRRSQTRLLSPQLTAASQRKVRRIRPSESERERES